MATHWKVTTPLQTPVSLSKIRAQRVTSLPREDQPQERAPLPLYTTVDTSLNFRLSG